MTKEAPARKRKRSLSPSSEHMDTGSGTVETSNQVRAQLWVPTHCHTTRPETPKIQLDRPALIMALNPDDRFLAVAMEDGDLRLYSTITRQLVSILPKASAPYQELLFAPQSTANCKYTLASVTDKLRIWEFDLQGKLLDPDTGRPVDFSGVPASVAQSFAETLLQDDIWLYGRQAITKAGEQVWNSLSTRVHTAMAKGQIALKGDQVTYSPDRSFMVFV
ncbi:hypothetical protein BJY00DRAFT_313832 [Aspergillus carlsbadensis]|nr:hypothetical protein BJY00DRAFT_313832 [Aspergillus carlsbadensis]